MILRPYQSAALDSLWEWFGRHPDGNPVMDCCVGSGKSVMIAAAIQRAIREYPETRVIVIVHQLELLEQNLAKLRSIWPAADIGVYCAALGRKELGHAITFATIGSVYRVAHLMGAVALVLADECHLISTKEEGMWRGFIESMKRCGNPDIRVVGWTGTPFRTGGIWITAGDASLFTGIAARVSMTDMLAAGYLLPLVPAATTTRIDASSVRTQAGDYNVADLARAADTAAIVEAACDEIVTLAEGRRRMLVFAVNVEHAHHVSEALVRRGVACDVVTGETPKAERAQMLRDYAADRLRCLVNVGVLTTGFDQPDIDFIALLRPTQSPTLAIQMCGRGMRTAPGKVDCAFADFTDTIARLGPIDKITGRLPPAKGKGQAPHKLCPECGSRNATSSLLCIDCGHQFPPPERITHGAHAGAAAVLSSQQAASPYIDHEVTRVAYSRHVKVGRPDSLRVDYYEGLLRVASEWVCIGRTDYSGQKARQWWTSRCTGPAPDSVEQALLEIAEGRGPAKPIRINVDTSGEFPRVVYYEWAKQPERATA